MIKKSIKKKGKNYNVKPKNEKLKKITYTCKN